MRSYTAVVPWYEQADFAELSAIGGHRSEPHLTYEHWHRSTMQAVDQLLREGNAVAFITIRPAAYAAWLNGADNTLEMRRRYAEHLATLSVQRASAARARRPAAAAPDRHSPPAPQAVKAACDP